MKRRLHFAAFCLALAATAGALGRVEGEAVAAPAADTPLNAAEMRALVARVVASQHRNDHALNLYERREHRTVWKTEERQKVEDDKLYRVVPTGTGTIKMVLADRGRPTPLLEYRKQLEYVEQALVWALDPSEYKQKQRVEKFEKRSAERRETVDAVLLAFTFTWLGRESRDGRQLVKLRFEHNPAYHAPSRATDMLTHATVLAWIEPEAAQFVRVEAELVRDFSFGAGFYGKVYKGGRFTVQQAPVEGGVWLPVQLRYDFKGRKFVFAFEMHEEVRASEHRRIGPPQQALAAIRKELHGAPASGKH